MKALYCLARNFFQTFSRLVYVEKAPEPQPSSDQFVEDFVKGIKVDEEFDELMKKSPEELAKGMKFQGRIKPFGEKEEEGFRVTPEAQARAEKRGEERLKALGRTPTQMDEVFAKASDRLEKGLGAEDLSPRQKEERAKAYAEFVKQQEIEKRKTPDQLEREMLAALDGKKEAPTVVAKVQPAQRKARVETSGAPRPKLPVDKPLDKLKADVIAEHAINNRLMGCPEAAISRAARYEADGFTSKQAIVIALSDVFGPGNSLQGLGLYRTIKTDKMSEQDAIAAVRSKLPPKMAGGPRQ